MPNGWSLITSEEENIQLDTTRQWNLTKIHNDINPIDKNENEKCTCSIFSRPIFNAKVYKSSNECKKKRLKTNFLPILSFYLPLIVSIFLQVFQSEVHHIKCKTSDLILIMQNLSNRCLQWHKKWLLFTFRFRPCQF